MGGRGELSKAGYSEVWTDQGDYCKQFTRVIECLPNLLQTNILLSGLQEILVQGICVHGIGKGILELNKFGQYWIKQSERGFFTAGLLIVVNMLRIIANLQEQMQNFPNLFDYRTFYFPPPAMYLPQRYVIFKTYLKCYYRQKMSSLTSLLFFNPCSFSFII